jgi:hypothetical protein
MFESYELYTKNSKKNIGEYGITKIDKNFILVIKATRDFIHSYEDDLKKHFGFESVEKFFLGFSNDSLVDDTPFNNLSGADRMSIPASDVNSTLMLGLDTIQEVDDLIGWLTYKIECDMWDDLHCK